ncbi:MAG: DUF3158 family protein [Candidatus Accumulibacter sp.]|jgi:hypothetical protein|nr:DUF3158 family protein [Accumulibacter sp.]
MTFLPLEQADFLRLKQAAYLKGLLRPFKGKGSLEAWANQCFTLRNELMALEENRGLAQTRVLLRGLPVELAQQRTGAGTTFPRWRQPDRSAMGTALWRAVMGSPGTPVRLMDALHAMEQQRIVLNMQVSLLHTLGRQARECADKTAWAEAVYLARTASP